MASQELGELSVIRDFALSLPEASEDSPWGDHSVAKVRARIFVFLPGPESPAMTVKLPLSRDEALAIPGATPTRYGLGRHGWCDVPLGPGGPELELALEWVAESYRAVAPKRLSAELDRREPPAAGPAAGFTVASGPGNMPEAELEVTAHLVRRLLREQHPELSELPLRRAAFGWDNVVFRLGPELAVRIPRRELGAQLVTNELRWLPGLAPLLPLPVPVPVAAGEPSATFPWPWAVARWVPGRIATQAPAEPQQAAQDLVGFLSALHQPAPDAAPVNPYRGLPLATRGEPLAAARERLPNLWTPHLAALWEDALAAPAFAAPKLWVHGDLHPANVLTARGRIVGIIDFGDLNGGDPATDLSVAWLALPLSAHGPLREYAASIDPDAWTRARGWAIALAMAIAASSADHPELAAVADWALGTLAEDGS